MRRPASRLLLLAGSILLGYGAPGVARAADHPPYMPTRDVVVAYDVQPQGEPAPKQITVWFAADGRMMRIDAPDGAGETILDRDRHLVTVVMNTAHAYMEVPERESLRSPFLLDASMHFTQAGAGVVASLPCTRWTITASAGNATACITKDGVVLSEAGVDSQGARGQLTARKVTYGPLPPATFLPPAGYSRVAHPEGPGPYERGAEGAPGGPNLGAATAAPGNP